MKRKIMTINDAGIPTFECIKDDSQQFNQYRVYKVYYENGSLHRKQLEKYADLESVLEFVHDLIRLYHLK